MSMDAAQSLEPALAGGCARLPPPRAPTWRKTPNHAALKWRLAIASKYSMFGPRAARSAGGINALPGTAGQR